MERELDVEFSAKKFAMKLVALLVLIGIVYMWRPLFHGIIYRTMYSPGFAILFGITGIAALILYFLPTLGDDSFESASNKGMVLGVVFVIALVLAMVAGLYAGMVAERTLAQDTMENSIEIDEFPEVNEENARVVTRDVSDVQTRGSVSYRTHRLGDSDIARMPDGSLAWSYALEPEGLRNAMYAHQRGVVMSDMTSIDQRQTHTVDDQEFAIGEGMTVQLGLPPEHRGVGWNLLKSDYMSQYNDDAVEFIYEDEAYMAYPKTGHEWHWGSDTSWMPHTTPTWDGVALVHQDGTIEHLDPEEAREHPVLQGQRLYPLDVTKAEMGSLGYRGGIVNQMGIIGEHRDEVEIADMPSGAGNEQPFVIDLAGEQMSYVTAMEPYGEDTRGLDEVWFADARTGEYQYFGTGGETLTGPERAMGIVRSEDTQTGWGEDFTVVEPIPVTIDDELWWHSKVVPTDNTDISRNVFVNAHTGDAVEVHNDAALQDFIAGEDPDEVVDVGEGEEAVTEPSDDPDVDYYIVIYDEDDNEIERIEIGDGEYITIEQETSEDE